MLGKVREKKITSSKVDGLDWSRTGSAVGRIEGLGWGSKKVFGC